jgi:hypothetical protein
LIRAFSIKKSIIAYQCGPDDDVVQWLAEIQHCYNTLCDMDAECMSNWEFALLILDNMPEDSSWHTYLLGLRAKVRKHESHTPPLPIHSIDFIVNICDEYQFRNKKSAQTASHVLSANDANRRSNKHTRVSNADAVGPSK